MSVPNSRHKHSASDKETQSTYLSNSHIGKQSPYYTTDFSGPSPKMKTSPVTTNEECWDIVRSSKRGKPNQLREKSKARREDRSRSFNWMPYNRFGVLAIKSEEDSDSADSSGDETF